MKKHIDLKRVGWTLLIPLVITCASVVFISVGVMEFSILPEQLVFPEQLGFIDWLMLWIIGGISTEILYLIIRYVIPLIIHFYWHNGERNKKGDLKEKETNAKE